MAITTIIIGIVSGAVLGALIDWLIQTRLPSKPSRSSTIVIIAVSAVLVLLLTIVSLKERQGSPLGTLPLFVSANGLLLCASAILSLVVVFVGIRAVKSISIHIRSELFGAQTEVFVAKSHKMPIPVARLIDTQGSKEARRSIPIMSRDRSSVGRDPAHSQIVIDNPTVARLHCSIYYLDGRFWITDEGSPGGTYVNDRRINVTERHELKTGDRLSIGACEFLFVPE